MVYPIDGDVVIIDDDGVEFTGSQGNPCARPRRSSGIPNRPGKAIRSLMLKEINEQPTSLTQALEGRIDSRTAGFRSISNRERSTMSTASSSPCGTSYHAALRLARAEPGGGASIALLANRYSVSAPPIDDDTLVIAVTQSGETADT